jgi:hypothetical protein
MCNQIYRADHDLDRIRNAAPPGADEYVMPRRWRDVVRDVRWYELVPEAVLAVGLGLFAVTEPRAAASGFQSTKAILLMVGVAIGWLVARVVTFRLVGRRLLRALPFLVGAFVVLKIVVLPAYDDHTVVETLTATAPASSGASTPPAPAAADPVVVRQGAFAGIDHRAEGAVNVYRRPAGSFVVGLENFDIQPGPAYALYVVPGADRRDLSGGTRLSKLRGNRGTQFYDVSSELDLTDGQWTVLVWCDTFDVPVAHATPA